MYPLKGTSVDRVYVVFGGRVDLGFLLFAKNGFVVRVLSLKVTACHLNNTGCCYEYTIVSVPRIARRYTIQCSLPNTHMVNNELDSGRQAGRQGSREGARKDGEWEGGSKGRVGGRVGTREHERGREGERGSEGGRKGEGVGTEGVKEGGRGGSEGGGGGREGVKEGGRGGEGGREVGRE